MPMSQESRRARPVQLHVIHGLGGGSAKWLADYCGADTARTNLVLRSFALDAAMGAGLALYTGPGDEMPIRTWRFESRIPATVPRHGEYRAALDEILREHGVQALLVSSVIGHSLEVLETGLPTVVVSHDYFPWCPAINLYFDGVCGHCDAARVAACAAGNPEYNPFAGFDAAARLAARERFVEIVRRPHVKLVAPSESVGRNLKRLEPRFADIAFTTIPHGYGNPLPRAEMGRLPAHERLRVLVLGQLSRAKGQSLLEGALPRIAPFADVALLGCREAGELFKFDPRVQVVAEYRMQELPGHVEAIRPHVGLLMSVVSETFGYALSELMMLGVPPVATRVGAFAERIEHGRNGFLYSPDVPGLVGALRNAHADRDALARVRSNLATVEHRSPADMVSDYHRLVPLEPPASPAPTTTPAGAGDDARAAKATEDATLASMWGHIRKLELELAFLADARHRGEMQLLADAEARRKLEARLQRFGQAIAEREAQLLRRDFQVQNLSAQVQAQADKLEEVYGSTSWRVSAPVRFVGTRMPRVRLALRLALGVLGDPFGASRRWREFAAAWKAEGAEKLPEDAEFARAAERNVGTWRDYRARLEREVLPVLRRRVDALARKPIISVVVPVYKPDKDMFRQMLESVRAQIYPHFELCLVDDGSGEAYVRSIMEEFAAADPRIRIHFLEKNRGIAAASNRALEMATGELVALVDHDDVLEEHALFRLAEALVEDDADMVYTDEALVTHDRDSVIRYAYRPAFSAEYLRSHPYIVHLVAFRAELLRAIGGWDEKLAISQDYDLILRASEQARRIAHVPELLYRWRIHGSSAGIARQGEVMKVSKSVLDRHLERTGVQGHAEDGPSFNLFATRYKLREGLKVAIVIPTKNQGDLLRQCVESIHATAAGAHYDLVIVDHESDDPATLAYLASIRGQAQILRYEGPFNFAAINNFAVRQLGDGYTHYLLCNNDIEAYEPGWLERMLELGQQPGVGIVGAKLYYTDRRTIQHAGVCIGLFGAAEHYGKNARLPEVGVEAGFEELLSLNHEVAAVTAACMLIGAESWREIDGFDEAIAVGFGDIDLCLRARRAGWRVVYCAHARLVHHESATRGVSEIDPHPTDSSLFRIKWQDLMKVGDPYYSPGLSLTSSWWEIKRPLPCDADVVRRVVELDHATGREHVTFSRPAPKGSLG